MTAPALALTNLLHQRGRTAVSVIGAAFAVVLVFMQLGFLGAVHNTATLLYDKLQFDLLLTSSEYIDLSRTGELSRGRLAQARAATGGEVLPLTVASGLWRNPTDDPERGGRLWAITVLGIDPGTLDRAFQPPGDGGIFADAADLAEKKSLLARLDTVLLDLKSRPDFGDPDDMPPGTRAELNRRGVELSGYFRAGTGFSYSGMLLASEETFGRYFPMTPASRVTFGLVQLPAGTDVDAAAATLRQTLPGDCRVFTRRQIAEYERDYWVNRTAVGQFFYFGVLLALTVGGIFIYQMMVADIKKHLAEYATLKAMGYPFGFLFAVVVSQALVLAAGGYAIGLVVSFGLYEVTEAAARLPIWMTGGRALLVFALTVAMCVTSGLLAVGKVRKAEPADLF
jgi:putative ABC transport system permease protein